MFARIAFIAIAAVLGCAVLALVPAGGNVAAVFTMPTTASVRAAVQRSLPYLEREGVAWISTRGCPSCHVVPFMLWSHNAARAAGIPVDDAKLTGWTDWAMGFSLDQRSWFKLTAKSIEQLRGDGVPGDLLDKLKPAVVDKPFHSEEQLLAALGALLTSEQMSAHKAALLQRAACPREEAVNGGGSREAVAQLLLGRRRDAAAPATPAAVASTRTADFLADSAALLARWQEADGSWKAGGQLPGQNRPAAESNEVSTMWAILALATLDRADAAAAAESQRRAREFLANSKPGQTNESLLLHLLLAQQAGEAQRERAAALLDQLRAAQNADGGWGWRIGNASDAFSTGQSIYALRRYGLPLDDPALRRAVQYLLAAQAEDGTWSVPPTAISPSTNPTRLQKLAPIYRYWGSAWASIGLASMLPDR
jgi:squalene-hopene/tetraprenyl-beta-curcumene cyclase